MDEEIPTNERESNMFKKTLGDFTFGVVVGIGCGIITSSKLNTLPYIMLGAIGAPLGMQVGMQITGKHYPLQERVARGVAAYAGCIAGQMAYQLLK